MGSVKEKTTYFRLVQNFTADFAPAEFTQWESDRTGMRVVVVDRKGPKVNGYFALATEIHDDSGAPHTLEHLCFMGSRSYKYKGVLDKLATRAYSNTNAWTATDHTAYTLDTAGWEGFAQILPVYLEHIIQPTLTDAGCYTEVHHIDGNGHDAGVVYSEMQGVQNTQGKLMDLQARRLMYPEGIGFRYETGGMLERLRVLTADRIRDFHKKMYQPKNTCLVIVGEVDHENLLEILDGLEDGILDAVPSIDAPFKRPWVESKPTPALKKTVLDTVEFPEDDETTGEVLVTFLGPNCNDLLQHTAVDVMLIYLAGSSVSVLENVLVEKEHIASAVYASTDTRPDIVIRFTLSSVATEKLPDAEKRLFELLRETASKPLDMSYLKDQCIRRLKRQIKYAYEDSNDIWVDQVIADHLFGNRDGSDLHQQLSSLEEFDELETWTDDQWRNLLRRWLADAHHISILGVPSKKLSKKFKEDEKARIKAQQERLGEDGLKKLAEKLKEAVAENEKPVPKEVLEHFEIPRTDSIHFFPTVTARSGFAKQMRELDNDIQKVVDKDKTDLPLFIHFEHIPTNFVHWYLVLNTTSIPLQLKPMLPIYVTNFFTTPIRCDSKRVGFEQVVKKLEDDTISYSIGSGNSLGNSELLCINFMVEREKYGISIKWVKDVLFNSIFDIQRLKATLTKMLADIPEEKRDGNSMQSAVDAMIHFSPRSSSRAQNTLVQALYLKRIKKLLKDDPDSVISRLEDVRKSLCSFSNFRALVIADVPKLDNPVSSWKALTSDLDTSVPLSPLDSRKDTLSDDAKHPGKLAYIVPMPTIDSSYALFTARGPDSYAHPQLPALMVALAYLDAVEGPLWVAVRGAGLAYSTRFTGGTDTGLLGFRIHRSPDAFKAYNTARQVVSDYASGKTPFEKYALEGAISSIVVDFANEQPTMASAAALGFINQVVRGVSKEWNKEMLRKVREVGEEQIREIIREVVLPVFEPGKANFVSTCSEVMKENLKNNFEEVGFKPEVQPLAYFQDDYGLKPVVGEEDGQQTATKEKGDDEGSEDESDVMREDD